MTVSHLDRKALQRLSPQEIASLALQADQEARRLARAGHPAEATAWDAECERLCSIFTGELQ